MGGTKLPGLGQLYNRHILKGVLFLAAGAGLSWPVARAVPALIEEGVSPAEAVAILALLAIWLWSVIDASRGAGRQSR